jgi:glycine/D-amino acid oxidase-like deaminating enzyme
MSTDTRSVWTDPPLDRSADRLDADATCDVCVVGAGIAGLTTAYRLTREGKKVLVLEAQAKVAAGETEYTTAHLSNVIDDRFGRLKSICGAKYVDLAFQSHSAAIDTIESVAKAEGIDCDFTRVDGYLFAGSGENAAATIDDEEKVAGEVGIPFNRLDRPPAAGLAGPCLLFPNQAQFHPLRYLAGVARAITARGGRIVTNARVEKVEGGSPCRVTVRGGRTVTAGAVVVATNTPINNGVRLNVTIAAYETYA